MRSREEFLKWFNENNDYDGISPNLIYDYFHPTPSEDEKTWLDAKTPEHLFEVSNRNPIGRTMEVNQFNLRQLQLDLDYCLGLLYKTESCFCAESSIADCPVHCVDEDEKERAMRVAKDIVDLVILGQNMLMKTEAVTDFRYRITNALLSFNKTKGEK